MCQQTHPRTKVLKFLPLPATQDSPSLLLAPPKAKVLAAEERGETRPRLRAQSLCAGRGRGWGSTWGREGLRGQNVSVVSAQLKTKEWAAGLRSTSAPDHLGNTQEEGLGGVSLSPSLPSPLAEDTVH